MLWNNRFYVFKNFAAAAVVCTKKRRIKKSAQKKGLFWHLKMESFETSARNTFRARYTFRAHGIWARIKYIRSREQGYCRCKMAGTRYHSVVANLKCEPRIATKKIILPRIVMKKIIIARMTTVKRLHLRVFCKGAIPVVASCGLLQSGLHRCYSCNGKPWYWSTVCHNRVISSNRQLRCSRRLIFLMRDFVKPIRGRLLRSMHLCSYASMVPLSRDTIPLI
jgi:hypothetical protein